MIEFVTATWGVMLALAPWLLLGALIAGVLHVVVPDKVLANSLAGRAGVFKAVAFGVPLPLCSCGVIPAGVSLKKRGASDGSAIGFLISTPQTGVDSVLVSASFLGWPFALFKLGSAALLGIVGGLLAGTKVDAPRENDDAEHKRGWRDGYDHAVDVIRSIWGWLLFGVLASAALTTWIPTEVLGQIAEDAGVWAIVAVLLISVPLYVCATASVPIAAALVAGGFPPGAALVFLMAGPATNVATIGAVYRTFGKRTLAVYLGTIIFGSIALGMAFDGVLADVSAMPHHDHSSANYVEMAAAVALSAAIAWFAFDDIRLALKRGNMSTSEAIELEVTGMTCNGCVSKLERAVREFEGVDAVEVQLEPGLLRVQGPVNVEALRGLVRQVGYQTP